MNSPTINRLRTESAEIHFSDKLVLAARMARRRHFFTSAPQHYDGMWAYTCQECGCAVDSYDNAENHRMEESLRAAFELLQ